MLEKDMGSVYKTCFIAWGRGSLRPNTLSVRVGSLVFNISCAVSCKVFHLLLLCGTKPQTSPVGRRAEQAGGKSA